jgi:hypothetical protein
MAAGLNDSNMKKAIQLIAKRGIDKAFWQDHRSKVANGSGVGKACDMLRRLGVGMDGDAQKVKPHDINTALGAFRDLHAGLKKAKGKCNSKMQSHTIKFCDAYITHVEKRMRELAEMESSLGKEGKTDPKADAKGKKVILDIANRMKDAKSEITDMVKDMTNAEAMLKKAQEIYVKEVKAEGPTAQSHHDAFRRNIATALKKGDVRESQKAAKSYLNDFKAYDKALGSVSSEGMGQQINGLRKDIVTLTKVSAEFYKKCQTFVEAYAKLMKYADLQEKVSKGENLAPEGQ